MEVALKEGTQILCRLEYPEEEEGEGPTEKDTQITINAVRY